MKYRYLIGTLACAVATLAAPRAADACTCGTTPGVAFVGDGVIPADLGGVAISRGSEGATDWILTLERRVDGAWVAEDPTVEEIDDPGGFERFQNLAFVRPEPFEEGDRFRVTTTYPNWGDEKFVDVEFDVGPPLPDITGAAGLAIGGRAAESVNVSAGGSCYVATWATTRKLQMVLPAKLEPYRDLLLYETTVDGEPWRTAHDACSAKPIGRSWEGGPGEDLLAAACEIDHEPAAPLKPGAYGVQMHAYFPGSPDRAWSTPVRFTSLECPDTCVEYDWSDEKYVLCEGESPPFDESPGCATVPARDTPAPLYLLALLGLLGASRRVGSRDPDFR